MGPDTLVLDSTHIKNDQTALSTSGHKLLQPSSITATLMNSVRRIVYDQDFILLPGLTIYFLIDKFSPFIVIGTLGLFSHLCKSVSLHHQVDMA